MRFFQLVKTLETSVGPDEFKQVVRLELYQSVDESHRFRARAFEYETFVLTPREPCDEEGEPLDTSHDELLPERGHSWLDRCWREFTADDVASAIGILIADFEKACRGE